MKLKRISVLWKHIAFGFMIGLFIIIPEFYFLNIKLWHAGTPRLSTFILATFPLVLAFLSYKFGSAKTSLLRTNAKLLKNKEERQLLFG